MPPVAHPALGDEFSSIRAEPDLPDDTAPMAEAVAMRPYRDRAAMAEGNRTVVPSREEAGADTWPIVTAMMAPIVASGIGVAVASYGPVAPVPVYLRVAGPMDLSVTVPKAVAASFGLGRGAEGEGGERDAEGGGCLADLPASDCRVRHCFSPILVARAFPRAACVASLRAGLWAGMSLRMFVYKYMQK